MSDTVKNWLLAARPRTLPAAAAPVICGTALALGDGMFHPPAALCALLGALLIQIGTNLANDYHDFVKGADTSARLGPVRVTQAGLVAPERVRLAYVLVFTLAAISGIYLIYRGGWPILAIGVLSILFGILYTAGPYPLGYTGLADIFVLVFFGPAALAGTYYVQALRVNEVVLLAGLAPGLFSLAILTINNLRDIDTDRAAGKKSLAVRFGANFARFEYLFAVTAGSLVPLLLAFLTRERYYSCAATLVFVLALGNVRRVFGGAAGAELNGILAATGRMLLIYSVLFSIGWLA